MTMLRVALCLLELTVRLKTNILHSSDKFVSDWLLLRSPEKQW